MDTLDPTSTMPNGDAPRPKYEQLRRQIAGEINSGRWKPGDALPTERWWADERGLARSTVRQALAALERDGLIRRRQGKGTFVEERARQRSRAGLNAFALVLPETQAGFYPSLQRSFDEAAAEVHHQLLVCNTGNNVDRQGNVILQLLDKQVAGVAIVPVTAPSTPDYQVRQLQSHGIPVVFCHRRVEGIDAPLLAIPFREVGRLAGRALAERGHRRVAFFAQQRASSSIEYEAGLRAGLAERRGRVPDGCTFFSSASIGSDEHDREIAAALRAMLDRPGRPTAIFTSFDSVAENVYLLLERIGLRVPDDISLVGIGGVSRTGPMMRRLTSVTVDEVQIGRAAATMLDQMRRGELPLDDATTHLATIGLSRGQTLGPAPRAVRAAADAGSSLA